MAPSAPSLSLLIFPLTVGRHPDDFVDDSHGLGPFLDSSLGNYPNLELVRMFRFKSLIRAKNPREEYACVESGKKKIWVAGQAGIACIEYFFPPSRHY